MELTLKELDAMTAEQMKTMRIRHVDEGIAKNEAVGFTDPKTLAQIALLKQVREEMASRTASFFFNTKGESSMRLASMIAKELLARK